MSFIIAGTTYSSSAQVHNLSSPPSIIACDYPPRAYPSNLAQSPGMSKKTTDKVSDILKDDEAEEESRGEIGATGVALQHAPISRIRRRGTFGVAKGTRTQTHGI